MAVVKKAFLAVYGGLTGGGVRGGMTQGTK